MGDMRGMKDRRRGTGHGVVSVVLGTRNAKEALGESAEEAMPPLFSSFSCGVRVRW